MFSTIKMYPEQLVHYAGVRLSVSQTAVRSKISCYCSTVSSKCTQPYGMKFKFFDRLTPQLATLLRTRYILFGCIFVHVSIAPTGWVNVENIGNKGSRPSRLALCEHHIQLAVHTYHME